MAAIRFYVNPLKNGTAQIIAALQSGSGTPPTKYTGYNIPSNKVGKEYKYWDKKKQVVKGVDNATEINKKIQNWKNTFEEYITDCNLQSQAPDMHFIKGKLEGVYISNFKSSNGKGPALLTVIDLVLKHIKATHAGTTYKGYNVIRHQVAAFETQKGNTLHVSDIQHSFYSEFAEYMMSTEDNSNKTVNRKLGKVRTMMRMAIKELKIKLPAVDFTSPSFKDTQAARFPLRAEELATLQAKCLDKEKPLSPYRQMVLHAFLLAAECGLRVSDARQIRPSHIVSHATESGLVRVLDFTMIKGSKDNNVPLSNYACSIIDQYTNAENTPLFPFQHSQPVSRVLKAIFEDLELTRPCEVIRIKGSTTTREMKPLHDVISFHMGRNTYITRLLSAGLPAVYAQGNAGHSDIKITMGYFRTDDFKRWDETLKILNK